MIPYIICTPLVDMCFKALNNHRSRNKTSGLSLKNGLKHTEKHADTKTTGGTGRNPPTKPEVTTFASCYDERNPRYQFQKHPESCFILFQPEEFPGFFGKQKNKLKGKKFAGKV